MAYQQFTSFFHEEVMDNQNASGGVDIIMRGAPVKAMSTIKAKLSQIEKIKQKTEQEDAKKIQKDAAQKQENAGGAV